MHRADFCRTRFRCASDRAPGSFENTLPIVRSACLRYRASSRSPFAVSNRYARRVCRVEPDAFRSIQPSEKSLRASEVAEGAVMRRCFAISRMVGLVRSPIDETQRLAAHPGVRIRLSLRQIRADGLSHFEEKRGQFLEILFAHSSLSFLHILGTTSPREVLYRQAFLPSLSGRARPALPLGAPACERRQKRLPQRTSSCFSTACRSTSAPTCRS